MEIPWRCRSCGGENWVDLANLDRWPLDRLLTAMGFTCETCGMREAISYTTPSLREAERKLTTYRTTHPKFAWHFARLVRKQSGVNERGEAHGKSIHSDLVVT